jgi:hypothetical protein
VPDFRLTLFLWRLAVFNNPQGSTFEGLDSCGPLQMCCLMTVCLFFFSHNINVSCLREDLGTASVLPQAFLFSPGSSSPAEALCTGFDRRSFCPNAGMDQPQLDVTFARPKPADCWENLCAPRSKSLNRIPVLGFAQHPTCNPLRVFAEFLKCGRCT